MTPLQPPDSGRFTGLLLCRGHRCTRSASTLPPQSIWRRPLVIGNLIPAASWRLDTAWEVLAGWVKQNVHGSASYVFEARGARETERQRAAWLPDWPFAPRDPGAWTGVMVKRNTASLFPPSRGDVSDSALPPVALQHSMLAGHS